MLSSHYPLAFATEFNWIIASLVFLIGVLIRHYFNSKHARIGKPTWTWLIATILFIIIIWISSLTSFGGKDFEPISSKSIDSLTETENEIIASKTFKEVRNIVHGRCLMCHATEPFWEGFQWPPKNLVLESDLQILRNAQSIYLQSGHTNAMPPGNISLMEPAERTLIISWYRNMRASYF